VIGMTSPFMLRYHYNSTRRAPASSVSTTGIGEILRPRTHSLAAAAAAAVTSRGWRRMNMMGDVLGVNVNNNE